MKKPLIVLSALLVLCLIPVRAEGNSCTSWSARDAFQYSSILVAKTFFYQDDRQTKSKAFLLKNDVVAIRNIKTDFACAVYVNQKGVVTIGWLEVKFLKDTTIKQNIVGKWETDNASLNVAKQSSSYSIKGIATFNTGQTVNTGDVDGKLISSGNLWTYQASTCVLSFLYLNNLLLVQDNNNCGGVNVSFTGTYRRSK